MSRQAACGPAQARERLEYALEQIILAEIGQPWPTAAARKASGASAVLAAIAASDAICCLRLGRRSRGADHRAAIELISTVRPDGPELSKWLRVALDAKDPMHYSTDYLSPDRHTSVLRAATALVDNARTSRVVRDRGTLASMPMQRLSSHSDSSPSASAKTRERNRRSEPDGSGRPPLPHSRLAQRAAMRSWLPP